MMISGRELNNVVRAYAQRVGDAAPKTARPAEKPAGDRTDTIALSDRARELAELKARLRDLPDVRAERVAQLKEQISAGEYSVSSEQIAEKMLQRVVVDQLAVVAERE